MRSVTLGPDPLLYRKGQQPYTIFITIVTLSNKSARCVWHKSCLARIVLSITEWASNVQAMKVRQYNVVPDLFRPTWGVLAFDSIKQHKLG